jgi:hypothetical protein
MSRTDGDLVVVVADKDIEQALLGLLSRRQAIGIRPIVSGILQHDLHDPGCYETGHELLALYADSWRHALVIFDLAWEGAPGRDRWTLQRKVESRLRDAWADRARCIVIDPEVENWVWSDSPHVPAALGWEGRRDRLRGWLESEGLWPGNLSKPPDPKMAFRRALREAQLPVSASVFRKLAEKVSFRRCADQAFLDLLTVLRGWFPPGRVRVGGRAGPST